MFDIDVQRYVGDLTDPATLASSLTDLDWIQPLWRRHEQADIDSDRAIRSLLDLEAAWIRSCTHISTVPEAPMDRRSSLCT